MTTKIDSVTVNGKTYSVTQRDAHRAADGGIVPAEVAIWIHWQVPSVADRWSARPVMIDKSASVSPYGRLGTKILKQLGSDLLLKNGNPTIAFKDMPDDMQDILCGFYAESGSEPPKQFVAKMISLDAFPEVALADGHLDKRGEAYALEMVGQAVPPVLVYGKKWLDGRHRVWAAKRSGFGSILAIDLIGQFPEESLAVFCGIGQLKTRP